MAWARQFSQPRSTSLAATSSGSDLVSTMANLRTGRRGSPVRVLEREEWRHGGAFSGLHAVVGPSPVHSPEQREEGLQKAQAFVR